MRTLLVALACALLAACGGDDGDSTPIITKFNTSQTALKVMLPGYEGDAIVEVNGTAHFVSGSSVHQLGVFPEGTEAQVRLVEQEDGYHCWPTDQHAILVDISFTVMFYCTKNDSPTRPQITWISHPAALAVDTLDAININAESPTGSPVLGFRLDVVSAPDGATFIHETPNTASQYQYFRMDTPGEYVIEVRAETTAGLSPPFTIEIDAYDPAPDVDFTLTPPQVYTDTDVVVTSSINDNDPSSVSLTHVWYINDTQVPDVEGNTLPSHLFKKGDSIRVEIIAKDPYNEVTTPRKGATVLDSPAELDTSNIPTQANRGTPLSVDLLVTDKDIDDTPTVSLAYGPRGMEINNNTLQWQVDPILITEEGLFHFGIALSENEQEVADLTLQVIDSERKSIAIAPPGTTSARLAKANQLVDYDNDGIKEAIYVDDTYMAITDMVSGEVEWALNALGRDRTQTLKDAVFVPRDGQTGLVAILSDYIDLIDPTTGKTVAKRGLGTIETGNYYYGNNISYVGGATPGNGFLVISIDSDRRLVALDQHTLDIKWRTIVGDIEEIAVVANLDTDPQDEIVTTSGYVFDGETGANQWLYESYTSFHTLYQENLGYSLGVYPKTGDTIRLVDFHEKSYTGISTGISNVRTMGTGNLDADEDDELIIVGYSDTTVFNYDGNTQSVAASGAYPVPYTQNMRVIRSFTDDNKASIVGTYGSSLRFHDILTDTDWNELDHLCGEKNELFLPTDADRNQPSISIAANCNAGGYSYAPFLASMDTSSKGVTYTESASEHASVLLTGLINNDLNPDAVAGNTTNLTMRDMATGANTWSIASPNTKHALMAIDINDDGVKEILSRNVFTIDIYDIVSQSILGQTIPASGHESYIYSAELIIDSSSSRQYLAVGKQNRLELYQLDENGVSLLGHKAVSPLNDIALVDYNADGKTEIAVLRNSYPENSIDIFDLDLNLVAQTGVPDGVLKLASYPDTGTHVLGVRRKSRGMEALEIDLRSGKATWISPIILGSNISTDYQKYMDVSESANGLHLRIIAGFSAVIAW